MPNIRCHHRIRSGGSVDGFTLIELIIAIVVAAILMMLALPSFRELTISSNITQTTNGLLGEINLAKSEALRRGSLVAVISNSGTNDWSSGWYVETDGDFKGDGTFQGPSPPATSKDVVLRTDPGVTTTTNNDYKVTTAISTGACPTDATTPAAGMIIFNGQGTLTCKVTAFDINVCRPDSNPARSKRITIVTSGMTTSKTDTTGSPAPGC